MAIDIVVPSLGESITEATVASWRKKPGEAVAADEALLELETDKATLEVPAPASGVLSEILVQEGEDVAVGAVLGRIAGGEARDLAGATAATAKVPPVPPASAAAVARPAAPRTLDIAAEPSAAAAAAPTTVPPAPPVPLPDLDPGAVPRSGPGGTVTLQDLYTFFERASQEAVERSGPAVRKLIADHGLDPARIAGSGRGGRITREDVLSYLGGEPRPAAGAAAVSPAPPPKPPATGPAQRPEQRVRMSRLRRTIATRLKEVQSTAAILTTFNEADMSAVIALRRRFGDEFERRHGTRLGFMSFFVKAAVAALKEMPVVNAMIDGDEIVYRHYFDIGIAVSTDAGLKVPVLRNCDQKSFAEIEREIADLAARARDGSLALEEMEAATFSITNGGVFGSLLATPIINPPGSAILGLHAIQDRPVAVEGRVEIRPMMYLALSYDHRLIDGRESVTFLVQIKQLIENPERLQLEV
jgi:2-oxoglutarate dehydrogenase E2 component (dihydrolipoamide succinyltransferase)